MGRAVGAASIASASAASRSVDASAASNCSGPRDSSTRGKCRAGATRKVQEQQADLKGRRSHPCRSARQPTNHIPSRVHRVFGAARWTSDRVRVADPHPRVSEPWKGLHELGQLQHRVGGQDRLAGLAAAARPSCRKECAAEVAKKNSSLHDAFDRTSEHAVSSCSLGSTVRSLASGHAGENRALATAPATAPRSARRAC